ncbi:hypothetical protein BpHYR1_025663 [Brachionus plicatilis]|uniref:Uncharacterized protein n=1 Tax=Brachionus plicatilis TaxID=10195 RepID=A0A3M7PIP5_BRAPC|nr:hypothetical protein BpHYR1_025663 [Brachionus plicatilis]
MSKLTKRLKLKSKSGHMIFLPFQIDYYNLEIFSKKSKNNQILIHFVSISSIDSLIIKKKFRLPYPLSYGSHSRYILKTCDVKVMFNFNY